MTLTPISQPSRETLRELLRQYHNDQFRMTEHGWLDKWLTRFMAWATPFPLRREDLDALWEEHDHKYPSAEAWQQAMKEAIWRWVCHRVPEKRICKECGQEVKP